MSNVRENKSGGEDSTSMSIDLEFIFEYIALKDSITSVVRCSSSLSKTILLSHTSSELLRYYLLFNQAFARNYSQSARALNFANGKMPVLTLVTGTHVVNEIEIRKAKLSSYISVLWFNLGEKRFNELAPKALFRSEIRSSGITSSGALDIGKEALDIYGGDDRGEFPGMSKHLVRSTNPYSVPQKNPGYLDDTSLHS